MNPVKDMNTVNQSFQKDNIYWLASGNHMLKATINSSTDSKVLAQDKVFEK